MENEVTVTDTGTVVPVEGATTVNEGALGETHEGTEVAHESGGMPQLDFGTFPNQIFWLVVALVAIYFVLSRIALPRIGAVLAERQGTITNDVAAAEELRQRAADAEVIYDKALADARTEANRIVAAAKVEIQGELDAELAKADERISARTAESEAAISDIRAQASASVAEVARDVAREIVSTFGTGADPAAVDAAVAQRTGGAA